MAILSMSSDCSPQSSRLPSSFTSTWLISAMGSYGRGARRLYNDIDNSDLEDTEQCRILNDRLMRVKCSCHHIRPYYSDVYQPPPTHPNPVCQSRSTCSVSLSDLPWLYYCDEVSEGYSIETNAVPSVSETNDERLMDTSLCSVPTGGGQSPVPIRVYHQQSFPPYLTGHG